MKKKPSKVKKEVKKSFPKLVETVHNTKIRIIGLGGGGGSIVSEIALKVKKADFVLANTDLRALKNSPKNIKKFYFGGDVTKGLGTGMNSEIGRIAAQNEKEKIKELFSGRDLCIVISCLGGGTSSGAIPVFAKIAKQTDAITFGIFTLPFSFEGEKKKEIAMEALKEARQYFNVYSVMPNEQIFKAIDKNTPLKNALSAINKELVADLEGLIEMIYSPGLINIDFADVKSILSGRGKLIYLNSSELERDNPGESLKKMLSNPLYPYTMKGAKGLLYNISAGNNLQLSEVANISKEFSQMINRKAKVIFGIHQAKKNQNKPKITLLASGCVTKIFLDEEKPNIEEKKEELPLKKKISPQKKSKIKKIKVIEEVKEIRRNGLEVKKAAEKEEKDFFDEDAWETPAILRKLKK